MRNYLILKERVAAFRADPEVAAALDARRGSTSSASRRSPTGETLDACAPRRSTSRTSTPRSAAGLGFERLDQLAMEHLLGAAC